MSCNYQGRNNLWEEICINLDSIEVDELKVIIGNAFIDEIIELHEEVKHLHEIWQESKEPHAGDVNLQLPEPPNAREQLFIQMDLFLGLLETNTGTNKMNILHSLASENILEDYKDFKEYGKSHLNNCNILSELQPQQHLLSLKSNEEAIEKLKTIRIKEEDGNGGNKLEELADVARDYLDIEKKALLEDVTYLQNSILHTNKRTVSNRKSSLKELRKVGTILEHEVLKSSPESKISSSMISKNLQTAVNAKLNNRPCKSAPTKHVPSPPLTPISPTRAAQVHLKYPRRVIGSRTVSLPAIPTKILDKTERKLEICADDIRCNYEQNM